MATVIYGIIFCMMYYHIAIGQTITKKQGESVQFEWRDITGLEQEDTIQIKNDINLTMIYFSAIETSIIRSYKRRIVFNGNFTGRLVKFTLKNISSSDAGEYTVSFPGGILPGQELIVLVGTPCFTEIDRAFNNRQAMIVTFKCTESLAKPDLPVVQGKNYIIESEDLVLNCSTQSKSVQRGNVLKMKYKWYFDGLTDLKKQRRFKEQDSTLRIQNITRKDRGKIITCESFEREDAISDMSEQLVLDVKYAAKINMTFPWNKTVEENSNVDITCSVDSNPESNISWSKDDKELNTSYRSENEVFLHFNNITCNNTGIYKCSAFNGVGINDTVDVKVDVFCKPRFVGNTFEYGIETKMKASIGEEIEMNVLMQAYPKPHVILNSNDINATFVTVSDNMFYLFLKKKISSGYDFRQLLLVFGNNQGNVTITIMVERRNSNFANNHGYLIGILLSLFVLIIVFVMITVVKRAKHAKGNRAPSDALNNVETDPNTIMALTVNRIRDRKPLRSPQKS